MDLLNDKLTREYNSLDDILLYLINHGLLSENERRIIVSEGTLEGRHSAIYKLLREKSKKKASDILKILAHFHATDYSMTDLSCFENLESSYEMDDDIDSTNPLLNPTIVRHMFQYLELDEILECRLVCEKWITVADPIVRKGAKIVFKNLEPDQFVRIFQHHLPSQPFTSFQFKNYFEHKTAIKLLSMDNFFEKWGPKIKDLTLYIVTIRNEEGKKLKKLNIDSWLRAAENLTSLNIKCGDTRFEFSFSSLLHISTLILSTCTVDLDVERKLSPSKIDLHQITFRRDKFEMDDIYLNTIIKLSEVMDLRIDGSDEEGSYTHLDLRNESVQSDKLVITHCTDIEWQHGQNWQVNCVVLQSINLDRKISMRIHELYLFGFKNEEQTIDLSALPDTIQKLTIICCNDLKFISTEHVSLSNLKHLCVDFFNNIPVVFTDFLGSLNLESITFEKYSRDGQINDITDDALFPYLNLDLAIIPSSVKAIKLHNNVNFIGDKVLNLDKLVLEKYSLSKVDELLQNDIKSKVLVLRWKQENDEMNESLVSFMYRNNLETLIVGKFECTFWRFQETRLSKLVDKQSTYYEFKQSWGAAITSKKFHKEMKLFTGSFETFDFPLY